MDLEELKDILNSDMPEEVKEYGIIKVLSKDERVIPTLMQILEAEREYKKEISSEMNVLLSKADVGLDNKKMNKGGFMQKEIFEFYKKYMNVKGIGHCFKDLKFGK